LPSSHRGGSKHACPPPYSYLFSSWYRRRVLSLWFDVELLRYRAPALPLLHEETGRALRRARALRCKPERNQPLLDLRTLQIIADRAVEPGNGVGGRARWRDHAEPAVHDQAGHAFTERRQIGEAGKA